MQYCTYCNLTIKLEIGSAGEGVMPKKPASCFYALTSDPAAGELPPVTRSLVCHKTKIIKTGL